MDHTKAKSLKRKTNKQTRTAFCISKKHALTCSNIFPPLQLLCQAQPECDCCCHLILNKSMYSVLFGDAVWNPVNCKETWKKSQLSACSTLYSHHCCFGWRGLLLCPVEKCLSSKCHFNLFSGGSESYSFPFRVEHSIWPVLKEKSLKTLLLKASLLAGVFVCVCVWWRKERQLCRQLDRQTKKHRILSIQDSMCLFEAKGAKIIQKEINI